MSALNTQLFGGTADGTTRGTDPGQDVPELLTANTSRVLRGAEQTGHYSLHIKVAAGTTPTGTLTVWYSNFPKPDPNNDAHWVQDAAITGINLATVANTFLTVGNVKAEYVRVKATVSAGTVSLIVWARVEKLGQ